MVKYNIHNDKINMIDFDNHFINFDNVHFYDPIGTEQYKLLSYLSSLYNEANILDVKTGSGYSAMALSYNESNTVYSFNKTENISPEIHAKNKKNIKFIVTDLFDENARTKWISIILSCPFIFLELEQHNGILELEFYNFLKQINYSGYVVCNNIWFFKEMRNNFWYKIPYVERYDLTQFGHWTGTGIINFGDSEFQKYDNSNWTLVTAYFNLDKCPDSSDEIKERDKVYYFSHSISTLYLPYNLVIFCDEESIENIKEIRPEHLNTHYVICEFDDFKFYNSNGTSKDNRTFKDYRDKIIENRITHPYYCDNKRNTASYYLCCMARYIMLKQVIIENPFKSSHFCWINLCIERMGYKNLIAIDEALSLSRNKFSTCYIDFIPYELIRDTQEYFKYGRCSMCSGFFTGNTYYMYKVCDLIENKFLEYLEMGYGHTDEQLYSPVYFENPNLFTHYYGDYFQMITNYAYIYDAPENPIKNFISNSYYTGNFKLCNDGCKYLLKSYFLDKYNINNDVLIKLIEYFINSLKQI